MQVGYFPNTGTDLMPPRALRPCKGHGCKAITRDPTVRCDACRPAFLAAKAAQEALMEKNRGTAAERGYGSAWVKIRANVLRKHGGLCADCKAKGLFVVATEVHHNDGNSFNNDFNNLIPLCREHHDRRHGVVHGKRVRIRS